VLHENVNQLVILRESLNELEELREEKGNPLLLNKFGLKIFKNSIPLLSI
jgi:hypothetical protein